LERRVLSRLSAFFPTDQFHLRTRSIDGPHDEACDCGLMLLVLVVCPMAAGATSCVAGGRNMSVDENSVLQKKFQSTPQVEIRGSEQLVQLGSPSTKGNGYVQSSDVHVDVFNYVAPRGDAEPAVPDENDEDDEVQVFDELPSSNSAASDFVWIGDTGGGQQYNWGDWQCPLLAHIGGKSVSACKRTCSLTDGCHAINYDQSTQSCQLPACSQPVVAPAARIPGYRS